LPDFDVNSNIDSRSKKGEPRTNYKEFLQSIIAILIFGSLSFYVFCRVQFGSDDNFWLIILALRFVATVYGIYMLLSVLGAYT
jgi:uncharacterized membrane protein